MLTLEVTTGLKHFQAHFWVSMFHDYLFPYLATYTENDVNGLRNGNKKHVIHLASKHGQCTMLFVNKCLVSFMKSDINESGTNRKQFHCPI